MGVNTLPPWYMGRVNKPYYMAFDWKEERTGYVVVLLVESRS